MNSKIKSICVLTLVFISGCSNSEYPQAKPTQINIDNTATVFIGSENITVPIPYEFEQGSKDDEKFIQILLNPIQNKNTEILATFKKANNLTVHNYFIRISDPLKSVNTDQYTSKSNFKKFKKLMFEIINDLTNIMNNPKNKEIIRKLEEKIGLYTINRSPINRFIDSSNTFGYSGSFDVIFDASLNQSSTNKIKIIKVSQASIFLRVKEKVLAVQVISTSNNKYSMKYVEQLSKKLAFQTINLNDGHLVIDPNPDNGTVESINADYIKELKSIKDLLDSGIIDNAEFKKMKQKIINKM